MRTINDTQNKNTTPVYFNTNVGRVIFYSDTGSKFEAAARLKAQNPAIKSVDLHHAKVYINGLP